MMTQPFTFDHAAEHARSRFQSRMAFEALQARIEARPMLPLHPLQTFTHQGETYSVERLETGGFDTLSPTAKYSVTLIRHSDGQRAEFPVIRKERRSKATGRATVRYNAPTGNYSTWDDLLGALVLTAEACVKEWTKRKGELTSAYNAARRAGHDLEVLGQEFEGWRMDLVKADDLLCRLTALNTPETGTEEDAPI
ncbi:hypothetical protein E7T09_08490 [Deinococcus sp. KSM4-11]|uniref:hypothetical protein n=1 Tax=Deinococcus sp. KSM4-11 TaxID=2568654 RepID=UPI0010A4162B|nr:hypothetical protein [Deinococcus sp. KSM4-11]THF87184.1 hypothetical protein E7T09_08490 [Deinococcus sp. KSM4-11]